MTPLAFFCAVVACYFKAKFHIGVLRVCLFVCVSVCARPTGRSLLSIFFILGILEPSRDGEEAFFGFLKISIFSIFNDFFVQYGGGFHLVPA